MVHPQNPHFLILGVLGTVILANQKTVNGSGIRYLVLFTRGSAIQIRDGKKFESGVDIPDHISESTEPIFGSKILSCLFQCCGSGIGCFFDPWIWYLGWKIQYKNRDRG